MPVASAVPTGRNLRSLQRQRRRHSIERRSLRTARTKWRPAQPPQFNASRYLFDLRTVSLFALARSHWFTGNLDRAVRYAAMAVEEADRSGHPIALCRALLLAPRRRSWERRAGPLIRGRPDIVPRDPRPPVVTQLRHQIDELRFRTHCSGC